ncbi:hypothetical protein AALM99_06800 [Lactococcus muris]|uniref:Uncharacterized protein n=1 Tax=Lactococcus muris TaxID=2941330 RepID=A0ABV4D8U2_9LACT
MWKQKVIPDVNVPGYSGGCLAYVDDGINPPNRQPTAQVSWQHAKDMKVAHPHEEPPLHVWVAVYYEILNGPWAGYGHVAWFYSDGVSTQIYDSEFGCGNRSVPYSSGAEMYNYMGWQMRYLGWSEAVDGKQVVAAAKEEPQKENVSGSSPQIHNSSHQKGEIEMYLIQIVDTKGPHKGKWYVSNGVSCRYVHTPRMLDNYRNKFGQLNLRVDKMYSSELFKEFPENKIL